MPLQEQLLSLLPPAVKAFLDGSSRRDLLHKVNASLLVFDNRVCHLESGAIAAFQEQPGRIDAQRLAAASAELLGATAEDRSILLLLPPVSFVATRQTLPGISKDSLVSALTLQAETLLPANDSPITLVINSRALEFTDAPVALWTRTETLVDIFEAFAAEGLFVAAIKPRILNIEQQHRVVLDTDATTLTLISSQDDVVLQWLQVDRQDLEDTEFEKQWQQGITDAIRSAAESDALKSSPVATEIQQLHSLEGYLELAASTAHQDYSFFPPGALTARKQVEKGRKLMLAAAVFAGLLFLGYIPFLAQSIQFRSLASTLESQRILSADARQDQAAVVSFENELGPLYNFPEQRVRDVMYTLQALLSPTQLSSLEISKGIVRLQGTSTEPQAILQRLEGDPMFTEVAFSRATSNDRFYIDLRLSTVNFEAYMVRYFPD